MKTSIIVIIVVILILIVAGAAYLASQTAWRGSAEGDNLPDITDSADPLTAAFRDQLTNRAIQNMGGVMPIEGFDADLLIGAFGGSLIAEDFDGVESFEGEYSYADRQLKHERTKAEPISTAERTISSDGYETLLENVSERLNFEVNNEADVTRLVEQLDPS